MELGWFVRGLHRYASFGSVVVGGLLLTVKAPSPDHNFIVVEEPSLEAKELFAQDNATSVL
jgi:hypothetical protein